MCVCHKIPTLDWKPQKHMIANGRANRSMNSCVMEDFGNVGSLFTFFLFLLSIALVEKQKAMIIERMKQKKTQHQLTNQL